MHQAPPFNEELRVGTVLFADIVGSTGIVAAHPDEAAHDIIGSVIKLAAESIIRFGGRVNRITGDGVMAMFGAPEGLAEHALGACAAALDMHLRISTLPHPTRLRIGLHSGEFLIHPLEAGTLDALDATGLTVHLAARLQQEAAPGETLISAATAAAAGPCIASEPLAPLVLKGVAEPQPAARLTGANLSLTRFDEATHLGQAFIGRAAERGRLAASLMRASAGEGHAVLVLGEPGIGKTRLAREIAASAPPGMRVLSTHALRWRREAALHPFAALLGRAPGTALDPALAALLGGTPEDPAWTALEASERRARTIAAAVEAVAACAAEGPALIIMDDLHWADDATVRALEVLLPRLSGQPVLLLLLARPEHGLGPGAVQLPTLSVGPLQPEEAAALARERGVPANLAPALTARCGGNPFFVEQAAALGDALPPHVRAMLVERVDRLPPGAREVLQMLSIIERPVAEEVLLAALSPRMTAEAAQAHLWALDGAGFLHRAGMGTSARIGPRHALLQEAVHRGLTRRRRQAKHARVAQCLAALPDADAEMLARHSWLGGLWAEALERNEAAARRALARYANREAVVLLDRALDALSNLPESPALHQRGIDLRLLQREPLFRLGESDRLTERLREAEALALLVAPEERVASLRVLQVHHAWMTGDLPEAERVLAVLEAQGAATGDETLLLRCAFQRGIIHMSRRQHTECATAMARVAADAGHPRHAGRYGVEPPLAVVALSYQARELADFGDVAAARAAADACLAAAAAVGRPFSWIFAVLADGYVMHCAGDSARAVARLSEALPHCEKAESALMRVVVLMLLGAAEIGAGEIEAARAHLEESVRMAEGMRFMALQDVRVGLLAATG